MRPENIDNSKLREYSPTLLAYVGDAVYELYVRVHLVVGGNRPVKEVHHDAVQLVRAESQAHLLREIMPDLNDEEKAVMMRGRNTKTQPPRHTDIADYRLSTGLEALIGYLYLKGEDGRLEYWLKRAFSLAQGDGDTPTEGTTISDLPDEKYQS